MIIYVYICTWIRYIFVRNYDFIYMIMDKWTMNWFLYPNQWGLFIGTLIPSQWGSLIGILIPSQWGLFIGILIPRPMGIIHWYSDTQTNRGCSLVFWYPNQLGLFIGTPISKPMGVIHWYSDTQPMRVIHWYSDVQSRGYNMTIVIRLLRIWITFEYLTILSP